MAELSGPASRVSEAKQRKSAAQEPDRSNWGIFDTAVFNWVNLHWGYRRFSEILLRRSLREFHQAGKDVVGEAPVKWEEILRGKSLTRSSTCSGPKTSVYPDWRGGGGLFHEEVQ